MSDPLALYVTRFLRDADQLLASLSTPVLVFEPSVDDEAPTQVEGEEDYRYRTESGVSSPSLGLTEPIVFPVQKSADNAFKRGVTVGRTSNNDVVLDDASVSRFHAWILQEADSKRWTLTDAGSKNGTFVNGAPLKAKRPMPLSDRVKLRFGQVEVTFYSPSAFIDFLKRRLGRTK